MANDTIRIRNYVRMNGGDPRGYRAPDGARFEFSLWNVTLCGLTPRQIRRVRKKHRRAIYAPRPSEVPF